MAVSLRTHLLEPDRHPGLQFHPDCPHCRSAPSVLANEPLTAARAATSRAARAATLLAGSALTTVAVVPVAQAQVEEETEGTESLGGSGNLSPEFEEGPVDPEAEREEPDDLAEPPAGPDPLGSLDGGGGEREPGSTAPGVLNAPAPAEPAPPPPAPPVPPPSGDEGPRPLLERQLGQQPTPPEFGARVPATRDERRRGANTPGSPRSSRGGESDQRGASPPAGSPLQPLPAGPGSSPLDDHQPRAAAAAPQASSSSERSRAAGAPARLTAARRATYRVRPGDSLWLIAEAQLGPAASAAEIARRVDRLWNLNGIRIGTGDPDLVMPGTILRLR